MNRPPPLVSFVYLFLENTSKVGPVLPRVKTVKIPPLPESRVEDAALTVCLHVKSDNVNMDKEGGKCEHTFLFPESGDKKARERIKHSYYQREMPSDLCETAQLKALHAGCGRVGSGRAQERGGV